MWTVKRRWTIALSALLVLLLLLQLPSIYKRHQLANLRAAIEALKQSASPLIRTMVTRITRVSYTFIPLWAGIAQASSPTSSKPRAPIFSTSC
jgi:hypothetical protein